MKAPRILAIVLCGGRGRRFGAAAKPLAELAGKPLVAHVVERLKPQVNEVVLSCSEADPAYERLGCRIVLDAASGEGPLGGIVSVMDVVEPAWLLTAPADTPFLPRDLVAVLSPACKRRGLAVASAGGRRQNLAMLMDEARAVSLRRFFEAGGRAAHRWLDDNSAPAVAFPADGFLNVNTQADLEAARQRVAAMEAPG